METKRKIAVILGYWFVHCIARSSNYVLLLLYYIIVVVVNNSKFRRVLYTDQGHNASEATLHLTYWNRFMTLFLFHDLLP